MQGYQDEYNPVYPRKKPFKQRLRQWLYNKLSPSYENTPVVPLAPEISGGKTLNLKIHFAANGQIVEAQRYNARSKDIDGGTRNLYIIHPDQEIGEELDKIITLECMR